MGSTVNWGLRLSFSEITFALSRLPLLTKVCFLSFGFTFVLALVTISFQTFEKLEEEKLQLENCIRQAIQPRLEEISQQVWLQRTDKLNGVLMSFSPLCTPRHYVAEQYFSVPKLFYRFNLQQDRVVQFGTLPQTSRWVSLTFPLSYWKTETMPSANAYWLGEMQVLSDFQGSYEAILGSGIEYIVRHFWVSLAGTILGFLLGYKMVIKRIRTFIDQLKSEGSYDDLRVYIDQDKTELSSLWMSIVNFRERLDTKRFKTEIALKHCQSDLAKAQRNSELKSQFLAKMSHELRTPMNGLLGFSTLLLESKLENEQREYAQTIQASLESLLYVVNDVLDLSRIESGDLNITSIPFSLRSVVSGATALLKNRAEAKGLEFDTRISADLPDSFRGDPVRIRQVMMNLAANAIRHTEKGYVLINVMLLEAQPVDEHVVLRIALEDSGLSVQQRTTQDVSDIEQGFSSEFLGKRSLGLDICFQLVELMESQLCQETTEKGGSSYWFDLRLPVVAQDMSKQTIDLSTLRKLKVLVVDSYELSRKITLELLQQWGVAFEAVTTAAGALKLLQNYAKEESGMFNMILCDDLLQDLSGIETCQRLRQLLPSHIPIVILCSNPQLGDAEGFFLSGANGFLSKQFRDPFLKTVMCQSYAERFSKGQEKRLITRYTVNDAQLDMHEITHPPASLEHVLIVESNIINQQLIMNMLQRNCCQVDIASNGFEAIELFKRNKYALVFMDCYMPDMDGFETTLILREIERSSSLRLRTPIIAMTTHDIEDEMDRCLQVGMDELMTKPLKIAKLEMVLARFIH